LGAGVKTDSCNNTTNVFNFWDSKTIEELAKQQGVEPVSNISSLYSAWPDNLFDGFEGFINEERAARRNCLT
jgi:hypothetical protein